MGKPKNGKKEKVPRLTEAEYAEYINSLKEEDCVLLQGKSPKTETVINGEEE